jgi:hypothetical protein
VTADEYADRVLALAATLEQGEAIAIPGVEVWLARSRSGLRFAYGWMSLGWPRGDAGFLLRDTLRARLGDRNYHYVGDCRRALDGFLARPEALRVAAIGRANPFIKRGYSRSLT